MQNIYVLYILWVSDGAMGKENVSLFNESIN